MRPGRRSADGPRLAGRVDIDLERLFVVDRTPTGNPLQDPVFAKIAVRKESSDALAWPKSIGGRARIGTGIRTPVLGQDLPGPAAQPHAAFQQGRKRS